MKKTFLVAFLSTIISCSSDKKVEVEPISENKDLLTQKISPSELKKYNSVKEMLEDAHDFTIEEGTLKFINSDENNLHLQVSKYTVKGESDDIINQTVKRDIVYVAFQAFAQTSTNKITITSVPIDYNVKTKYYNQYKKTITITRQKADQIMQQEFGNTDYSILFDRLNTIQIPSKNFDKLKFENLDKIYSELLK